MTQPIGKSKRGGPGAPNKDRATPRSIRRVGPLLAPPPPIVFRTPQRPAPSDDAPNLFYRVVPSERGESQAALDLSADHGTRVPALSVVCCVTGVSLADIAPMVLHEPMRIRFAIPDVPGNIRLEAADPDDTSISIQHPPARTRSFGVERTQGLRRVVIPKLPAFAGFRRRG
ncbi:hypothetical protein EOI86_04655 [Hwanghaeella grinnelliae]|uniref:Uncharacterized protein n=1 Tax=Hwanghaeella grinnelliae TaxID=2500179 RepID=A0A3S2WU72_9PROT|nr:hypothetical protein [Hwanghaeella grinnelliae]RVU38576.1 hypothetical protein EOI86_04655 [Hwanghaeella grinnelliae]